MLPLIERAGGLSEHQYGFQSGKSTVDAIQEVVEAVRVSVNRNHYSRQIVFLVMLVVRNAFNSARWIDMLEALDAFQVPKYLKHILRGGEVIQATRVGKYLEISIDSKMKFFAQI